MRKLLILLFLSFLLFGCLSFNQNKQEHEEIVEQGQKNETQSQGLDYISELFKSGKKIKCTYKYVGNYTGGMSFIIYFHNNYTRVESPQMTIIVRPNKEVYVSADYYKKVLNLQNSVNLSCDWIKTESYGNNTGVNVSEYEFYNVNKKWSDIKCEVSDFTDSIFDVSGKICSLEEFQKALTTSFCYSIQDEKQRQACIQAIEEK